MPSARQLLAMDLWYCAQRSSLGIEILTTNISTAESTLNQARRALGDPALKGFTLTRSPLDPTNRLWILRTQSKNEALGLTP